MADLAACRASSPVGPATGRVALALAGVYLVWGSTYLGNRLALDTIDPLVLTASRFVVAGGLLVGLAAARGADVRLTRATAPGVVGVGLLLVGAGSSLLAIGQQWVDSGLASLLVASTALWTLLMNVAAGRRPPRLAAVGVLVGFVGLLLLGAGAAMTGSRAGLVTLVVSTVCWSAGSFLAQRTAMPADGLVNAGWQMLVGGAVVSVLALVTGRVGGFDAGAVSLRSAVAWAALTFLCTAVGFGCYAWLLQHTSLSLATTYAYVNPMVAVGLGALVLGERLRGLQVPGALLVLVAVAAVVLGERRVGLAAPPAVGAEPTPAPAGDAGLDPGADERTRR